MNIKDKAQDFSIYIFSQNVDLGVDLKLSLKNKNYQVDLFSDHDQLQVQFEINPSHILIIDTATLIISAHQLIEKLLKISDEIRFILIAKKINVKNFIHLSEFNVQAVYNQDDEFLTTYVSQACDTTAESLYRFYQNEQMLEMFETEKIKHDKVETVLTNERSSTQVRPYQIRISQYKSCQSKEELLDIFYQQAAVQSWIYLKFISTIETFISVSSHQVPEHWIEGLSYKIPITAINFKEQIFQGLLPDTIEKYLLAKFHVEKIKFIPLIVNHQIEGLMVSPQDITADSAEDFSLMSLVYTNIMYESMPKYMDVEDQLTGFYNQLFYKRVLEKELDRSKRTTSPLSVVKISIDKFLEIESTLGKLVVDDIIKKVAVLIKETSRLPDYICRTGDNEFSLLLVNCGRKGAVIRSERLRESLNKENYSHSGIVISISQGISEYPTLSSEAQLNDSAYKAMRFISEKGGDKICLSKAPHDYNPDFMVND